MRCAIACRWSEPGCKTRRISSPRVPGRISVLAIENQGLDYLCLEKNSSRGNIDPVSITILKNINILNLCHSEAPVFGVEESRRCPSVRGAFGRPRRRWHFPLSNLPLSLEKLCFLNDESKENGGILQN